MFPFKHIHVPGGSAINSAELKVALVKFPIVQSILGSKLCEALPKLNFASV